MRVVDGCVNGDLGVVSGLVVVAAPVCFLVVI